MGMVKNTKTPSGKKKKYGRCGEVKDGDDQKYKNTEWQ
jgi:hypothetical protein